MVIPIKPRQGTPITLRVASSIYGVAPSTLSRWAARGLVVVISPSPSRGYPCILDEHSVYDIAELYLSNPGQGKRTVARSSKPISRVIGPLNDQSTITHPVSELHNGLGKEAPCKT